MGFTYSDAEIDSLIKEDEKFTDNYFNKKRSIKIAILMSVVGIAITVVAAILMVHYGITQPAYWGGNP